MASDLNKTWNDYASRWDDWGSPLRPHAEDIRIMRDMVAAWHRVSRKTKPRVFLCGVTPEIVAMDWPFPLELTGMDKSESMVRLVWPGDVPGVRRAGVGCWVESGLADGSQDIVIGDGGFVFFAFPEAQRTLLSELRRVLAPDGLFVYRHYSQANRRESPAEVLDAVRSGTIGSFHVLKWRLAMALQQSSTDGVRQHDIWSAWNDAGIETSGLPQPGWSQRVVSTIEFYRGKQARFYFPALREFVDLLGERYTDIETRLPAYELGERCPVISARPRA